MKGNSKKICLLMTFCVILIIQLSGCGDGGYETESRLTIDSMGTVILYSDVVEDTDDTIIDDNRPQAGEDVTNELSADTTTITFSNVLRPFATEGRTIEIYRYVITYYDAETGITPTYAPQVIQNMTATVPVGSATATLVVEVVPVSMKLGDGTALSGLRDVYLFDLTNFNSNLSAQIDFYGRDPLTDASTIISGTLGIVFDNIIP